jgi:5'-AMP-activated protein kinase, catalytic alpha subunit
MTKLLIFIFFQRTTWTTFIDQRRRSSARGTKEPAFQLLKVIGAGGFGPIFDGIVDKKPVIIKCVDGTQSREEIKFLKQLLNTPGIVQYVNTFVDETYAYIVMKKIDHVIDLYEFLIPTGTVPESTTQIIIKQLVNILSVCKKKGILHNDVSDSNILINPETLQITLINFNAAQKWQDVSYYYKYKGTEFFSCPEWRHEHMYTANGMTSWSVGILMYMMLFGDIPSDELYNFNSDCISINETEHFSGEALNFLKGCLHWNPLSRITLDEMTCHPWIKTTLVAK